MNGFLRLVEQRTTLLLDKIFGSSFYKAKEITSFHQTLEGFGPQ